MTPLGNNVIVKVDKALDKRGKVFVPQSAKQTPASGVIVAVHKGSALKKGQKVLYKKFGEIPVESLGKDLVALDEEDLIVAL